MTYSRMAVVAAGFAITLPAFAGEKADAPELAGYTRTGETASCLMVRRIDRTKILNDHQILFEMNGGETWLNEPSCAGLTKHVALSYEVHSGQICDTTIVTLVEPAGGLNDVRGSCALSKFEKLERKVAAAE